MADVVAVQERSIIIGSGGLLGSAVRAALPASAGTIAASGLSWANHEELAAQFRSLVAELQRGAVETPWVIYWCAGVGHVGASDAVHAADQQALSLLLEALRNDPPPANGVLALASSAGAIYAGNTVWPATESTPEAPIHGYGESKLAQEKLIREALPGVPGMRTVFLRISNLYGLGQTIGKPQGLLSHLVVNTFRRSPSMIFVPLDTSRDYLFTTDAANMVIRATRHALHEREGTVVVRILAAEQNHTIAQVMATLSRIMKRRVPFVARLTANTSQQPPILSFRSTDLSQRRMVRVSLEEGIARIVTEYAQSSVRNPEVSV